MNDDVARCSAASTKRQREKSGGARKNKNSIRINETVGGVICDDGQTWLDLQVSTLVTCDFF